KQESFNTRALPVLQTQVSLEIEVPRCRHTNSRPFLSPNIRFFPFFFFFLRVCLSPRCCCFSLPLFLPLSLVLLGAVDHRLLFPGRRRDDRGACDFAAAAAARDAGRRRRGDDVARRARLAVAWFSLRLGRVCAADGIVGPHFAVQLRSIAPGTARSFLWLRLREKADAWTFNGVRPLTRLDHTFYARVRPTKKHAGTIG
ncbi:unnamed protein product, partial [Ixodes persulcatus]